MYSRLCSHWSVLLVIATECRLCKFKTAPTSLTSAIYIPIPDPMLVNELQLVCPWPQVTEQNVLRCKAYILMYVLAGSDMLVDACQSAEASRSPSSAVPPARQRVFATTSTSALYAVSCACLAYLWSHFVSYLQYKPGFCTCIFKLQRK